ncbi:hypothetical protein Ahy_A04g018442 [Arachis hypogaea]|uniref:Uncharacterized protein n=1 Tax=Arachis hypogaea TaxID=3818 RepID=A0A445DDM6_ARAHY|nr:hypothetical protein Ahy_A04g018442 [Arachis hypogaea]
MKKELAHREEQASQRQPIRGVEGQTLKTPQPSVTTPLSRSQAIEVDGDEEYFDEGDDDMIETISIIPTEYLGEYEGDPEEDYDMEDEETFSFIRIEDEPGYFLRPTKKQMSYLCPLHITTILNRFKINKVLIDGGSAINLLPERMLRKVEKHPDDLFPTNIVVTDFSGTSTLAKGLVTLTVKVGSSETRRLRAHHLLHVRSTIRRTYRNPVIAAMSKRDFPIIPQGRLKLLVVLFQKQVTAPIIQGSVAGEKWESLSSSCIPKAPQSAFFVGSRRWY